VPCARPTSCACARSRPVMSGSKTWSIASMPTPLPTARPGRSDWGTSADISTRCREYPWVFAFAMLWPIVWSATRAAVSAESAVLKPRLTSEIPREVRQSRRRSPLPVLAIEAQRALFSEQRVQEGLIHLGRVTQQDVDAPGPAVHLLEEVLELLRLGRDDLAVVLVEALEDLADRARFQRDSETLREESQDAHPHLGQGLQPREQRIALGQEPLQAAHVVLDEQPLLV